MPLHRTQTAAFLQWRIAAVAAVMAVGGALAMTVIVGLVALIGTAMRGVASDQVPWIFSTDPALPVFCAAAGVACAFAAGYLTAPAALAAPARHAVAAGVLAVVLHIAVIGILGSPLSPVGAAIYVGLTLPAMAIGCYAGTPGSA